VEVAGEVVSAAKAGTAIDELDDALNRGLHNAGLSPSPYGLGHGIGLRAMEPPSLISGRYTDVRRRLLLGETIAIEPETIVEIDGIPVALKVEDYYVVDATGLTPLGETAPAELLVLGG
jgi:Xaa-Pro aminopeptidase